MTASYTAFTKYRCRVEPWPMPSNIQHGVSKGTCLARTVSSTQDTRERASTRHSDGSGCRAPAQAELCTHICQKMYSFTTAWLPAHAGSNTQARKHLHSEALPASGPLCQQTVEQLWRTGKRDTATLQGDSMLSNPEPVCSRLVGGPASEVANIYISQAEQHCDSHHCDTAARSCTCFGMSPRGGNCILFVQQGCNWLCHHVKMPNSQSPAIHM